MYISGFQKVTLLDFPNLVACTIFAQGCNFNCPFCHNGDLVNSNLVPKRILEEEVFDYLKKRKGIIDGVCITGGEPTLQNDLEIFIKKIKELGFKVKLDTNGYRPDVLKKLVEKKLIDYVAMDIKNSFDKYELTTGCEIINKHLIKESISYLLENNIPYEFRTTVVKEFHELSDFTEIGLLIKNCSKYYLQQFKDSETCIKSGLHAHSENEMYEFLKELKKIGVNAYIRGEDVEG